MNELPAMTVRVTAEYLRSATSCADMLQLPAVKANWISWFNKSNQRNDGDLRFDQEFAIMSQKIGANPRYASIDPFSLYNAWMELSISGLSLREDKAYIIAHTKKAIFMPSWKGRLDQLQELPQVVHVHEPQVVWSCDVFNFSLGMDPQIYDHRPIINRPADAQLMCVYMVIQYHYGPKVYMMMRDEVLRIRDQYSESYKTYAKDMKASGGTGKVKKRNGTSGQEYEKTIEETMWTTDEPQAWKKTLVKRTYNNVPKDQKTYRQKYIDDRIEAAELEVPDVHAADDYVGSPFDFDAAFYSAAPAPATQPAPQQQAAPMQYENTGMPIQPEQPAQAFPPPVDPPAAGMPMQAQPQQQAPAQQPAAGNAAPRKTGGRAQTKPTAAPGPTMPTETHQVGTGDNALSHVPFDPATQFQGQPQQAPAQQPQYQQPAQQQPQYQQPAPGFGQEYNPDPTVGF